MRWWRIGSSLALLTPAIASAEPIAIPFAPPTGQALVYSIEQHRPVEGRVTRFGSIRHLRFEAVGDGYILYATLRSIDSDAPESGAALYRAALTPLVGVEHRFRLNARGQVVAMDNMDAVWAAVQAGLDRMLANFASDTPGHRATRSVQAMMSSLSRDSRLSLLAGELQPLFLFAGGVVEDGAGRGVRTMAGAPLGRPVPVEGVLLVTAQSDGSLDLGEKLAGAGTRLGVAYCLSRRTGLVEFQRRELVLGDRTLTEMRTLTQAQK